ncbi:MAG: vanadium-dependent haloperoxidase [Waddliaceae bacterium]
MKTVLSIFMVQLCLVNILMAKEINPNETPLSFSYDQEQLEEFKSYPLPKTTITNGQLTKLNQEADFLIKTNRLSPIDITTLPAYLANAQKDFAWISYRLTGKFTGDLGPITLWILRLFIPNASLPSVNVNVFDPYSSGIAALVLSRAADRLNKEREQIVNYPIKKGANYWTPTSRGYRGIDYGTAKTWYLNSSKEFVADTPPQDRGFWQKQTQEVQEAMDQRDRPQTASVYWWANLTSPNAGEWHAILQQYFEKWNIPLANRLWGMALLECTLLDSTATAFNSKYTYWVKRPSQMDPHIKPLIAVPNHPSYPSAHSTNGIAVAVVLTKLFPDNQLNWNALAEEAGMSRIWGGIHYPVDHEKGKKLGKEIGLKILEKSQQAK